jgi:hypothetical protein
VHHIELYRRKRSELTVEQLETVRESLRIAIRDRSVYVADPRDTVYVGVGHYLAQSRRHDTLLRYIDE